MTDQAQQNEPERSCPRCGEAIVDVFPRLPGRPRRWCSAKCRRSAFEERRAAAAGAIATHYVQVDVSLDDHVKARAIDVCGPPGQRAYLTSLRCADGQAPTFDRAGNVGTRNEPAAEVEESVLWRQMDPGRALSRGAKE